MGNGARYMIQIHGRLFNFSTICLGRTGTFFAYQAEGVMPDAVACAKALAGGLPMGALLARGEAAEAFQPGDHASTFGGGLLVSAAAHAVLDVVLADGFLDDLTRRGHRLRAGLERLAESDPNVAGVRALRVEKGRGRHACYRMFDLIANRARAQMRVYQQGLRGMQFVHAAIESFENGSAWVPLER